MSITAQAVKQLRELTGLPMMECKQALQESNGDLEGAKQWLREQGKKTESRRSGRDTAFGRMGIFASLSAPAGAMVELRCESAPVTQNEEFIQFANDLAQQLATAPGVKTAEELLAQPCPSQPGKSLGDVKDDLFNRIREILNIGRLIRLEGPCAGYSHNAGTVAGVLLSVQGDNTAAARDICMHIAAMRPKALRAEELDPTLIAKEREILAAAARNDGKPESIIEKMVDGRMRTFFAETVLLEQAFVKDNKTAVKDFATQNKLTIQRFVHWELTDGNEPA
ncbi:MAG: translation elongation factor Ts [Planctomycetota bacterium]|nr:translation elongation factor Ts [Planctomycetota bacterium]MDA1179475.1 translation elongation factor Ts [Planctomycetota bacterium]